MWKTAQDDRDAEANGAAAAVPSGAPAGRPGAPLAKKLVVLVVAGLVLAGGGIGAARFLGAGSAEAPDDEKVTAPLIFEFSDIIVNVGGTHATRVLRCIPSVEVDNAKALDELQLREVVFHDAIINILRSKTLEDLEHPGENAVKRQIRDRLNQMLVRGSVTEVYLKEFLIH